MKKQSVLATVLLMLLLFVQALPAFAVTSTQLVNDEVGILSAEEVQSLEEKAVAIQSEYGVATRILVVPSLNGNSDAYEYAKALYNQFFATADENSKGMILLMLSMQDRDYALIANREGNDVFTDYGKSLMQDDFLGYFANDDWLGGFNAYLETANADCYEYYVNGKAVDVEKGAGLSKAFWILALIGSPIIGGCAVWTMSQRMRTAKKQTNAELYVGTDEGDAFSLKNQSDDYLYSQTIVVPHPKFDDNDGFGGGGTSVDFGGFSGDSGKF